MGTHEVSKSWHSKERDCLQNWEEIFASYTNYQDILSIRITKRKQKQKTKHEINVIYSGVIK